MIRFGIVLSVVLIAIGLLVTGTVAGSLLLVMVSIGIAALAALMLLLVVLIWRREIFGTQLAGSEQTARAGSEQTARQQASPEAAIAAYGAPARAGAASGRAGGAPGRVGYPVAAAARADASGNEADVLVKPAAAAGEAGATGATKVRVPTSHAAPSERSVRRGRSPGSAGGRGGDESGAVVPDDGRSAGRRRSGAPERRGATGSAPAGVPPAPAPAPAAASAEPVPQNANRAEGDTARRDRPERLERPDGPHRLERPERLERQERSEPDRPDADRTAAARAGADSLFGARVAARRPDSDSVKPDPLFGGRSGSAGEPRRAATEAAGGRPARDRAGTPSAVVKPGDEGEQPKPAPAGSTSSSGSSPKADQPEEATQRAAALKAEPARAEPPKASAPRTDLSRAADRPTERRSSPPTPATKDPASADTAAKAADPAAPSVTPPVTPPVAPPRKPAAPTVPKEASADSGKPAATDGGQSTTSAPASTAPASTAPASTAPASTGPAKDREPPAAPAESAGSFKVRVVPGIARYHAQGCILIRFLAPEDLEVISIEAAAREGYVACKACKPDQAAAQAASS